MSDGFNDDTGNEAGQERAIIGTKLAFSNEAEWLSGDDEPVSPDLVLCPLKVRRVYQKWVDQSPVETHFLEDGEKCPDLDAMNAECPKSEWSKDFSGNPRGPWQFQNLLRLTNLQSMEKYTYPTNTVGGNIAIDELKDAVKTRRLLGGSESIYPLVKLTSTHMNTRFGGRERPKFEIVSWIGFGPGGRTLGGPKPPPLLGDNSIAVEHDDDPRSDDDMGGDGIPY
jgi:hypothetical protein